MAEDVLDRDDVQCVLERAFYAPGVPPRERPRACPSSRRAAGRPAHYKVICISMYTKDLARLDDLVTELKARGNTKMNRSALIRAALEQVDLGKVPRAP